VITEFPIPTPDSGPRALAAGPDGNIWFSEFNTSKIGRITAHGSKQGLITEYELPRPNGGPGDITAGADGNLWFNELAGNMDGRRPDGNRIGRITLKGAITEFQIPSKEGAPINIAVGPDRNIWYTKPNALGRVTPEGVITEFPLTGPMSRPVGLSAGADRQPPKRLSDRLWYADGGLNAIGWLGFK
jgi:streptogramin lyase